jgi:hypothetical protein
MPPKLPMDGSAPATITSRVDELLALSQCAHCVFAAWGQANGVCRGIDKRNSIELTRARVFTILSRCKRRAALDFAERRQRNWIVLDDHRAR